MKVKERRCPTLDIQLAELKENRQKGRRQYITWVPGFGNPCVTINAPNTREALKILAEFVGNELMAAGDLVHPDCGDNKQGGA